MTATADVWSLGMTLVESLTQQLPVWQASEQEFVLPKTMPTFFVEVARHCLRGDPQHRWTVADIKGQLQPIASVLGEQAAVRPKWSYMVPTAIGLGVLAILAGPRLIKHHPQLPQTSSSAFEQPDVETPRAGVLQGAVVHQVVPNVPQRARDTIRGTVRVTVRVAVDPEGSVTGATLDSPGPSKYFADLALQAARSWKFRPTRIDGRSVSSEWILRFQFERDSTHVAPMQAAP